jgi:N-methylhydantoinase A
VTDANVVLGLLRPEHFLGGEMRLEPELAREAVASLGISDRPEETAAQVVRVVDANMTQAIRLVSTERGIDPAGYTLVPYGGAGPLHACRLAEALGIHRVLVPPFPGLTSAYGLLVADLVVDVAQTDILGNPDGAAIDERFAALDDRLATALREQGLPGDGWTVEASIDMRYSGQAYELVVPVERPVSDVAAVTARFHDLHGLRYGVTRPNDAIQAVTWRLRASRPVPDLPLPRPPAAGQPVPELADVTLIDGPATIPFYDRATLPLGFATTGACVIEEPTATTFVPGGWMVTVDEHGCLVVTRTA